MTNLEQFDQAIAYAHRMRVKANELMSAAAKLETDTYREFGIHHVSRDPGFKCWTHDDLDSYHETPRAVMEALEKRTQSETQRIAGEYFKNTDCPMPLAEDVAEMVRQIRGQV